MKNLISIFLFSLSFQLLAQTEYYLYHNPSKKIEGTTVLSQSELDFLTSRGINYQITKIKSNLPLSKLKAIYGDNIEPVQYFNLHNYTEYQWYLNNTGGELERRITDIDVETYNATAGEDIQNIEDSSEQTKKIRVAIIDSGIDTKHPDLQGVIVTKEKECETLAKYKACLADRNTEKDKCHADFTSIDNDGDGYPLDCQGWSMTNTAYPQSNTTGNPEVSDSVGHGTHVAGIIGAVKNNIGIDGVADNIEILPVQVSMNSSSDNPIDNIAKGVIYALRNNANVINLSLGWRFHYETKLMRDTIKTAINSGVAVIVAAANDSHSDISYPCAYDDVICVGAHDQTGKLASFSNRGTAVDIIAPGVEILSTWVTNKRSRQFTPDDNYEYMSGTSQAAPIVSGVVARLMSRGFTANQAKIKILKGARKKLEKSDIRFGNLDYKSALKSSTENFLYPAHKEAALIVYKNSPKNNIRIKIKNLSQAQTEVPIELKSLDKRIEVISPKYIFDSIAENETKEIDFSLNIKDYSEAEHRFELSIRDQNFIVRANIVRVVSPDIEDPSIISFNLNGKLESTATLRSFENHSSFDQNLDFFAVTSKKNQTLINLVKFNGTDYTVGRALPIRDANPVFLNFSKVDFDKDNKIDYIITYVTSDKDGNKTSKFLIFNHDLTPKRVFLTPENKFDNKKTFLPGKFKWIDIGKRLVPTWVGFGERGTEVIQSPWETPLSPTNNFVYYLDPEKGLQNFLIPKDETPLHFLYQTKEETDQGVAYLISFSGNGFVKEYKLYKLSKELQFESQLMMDTYFDLFEPRPLPLESSSSSAFFNESSNGGSQIIYTIKNPNDPQTSVIRLPNIFERENIQFVKSIYDDFIFYQTDHKIAVFNRATNSHDYRESKVNTMQRRYVSLETIPALFLPAKQSPSYVGELLRIDQDGKIQSSAAYRTLSIRGCEEIELVRVNTKEFLSYTCLNSQKILLLTIE